MCPRVPQEMRLCEISHCLDAGCGMTSESGCVPPPILGPSLFPRSGILGYQGNEPLWFNLALVIKCYGGTSTGVGKKKKKKRYCLVFKRVVGTSYFFRICGM